MFVGIIKNSSLWIEKYNSSFKVVDACLFYVSYIRDIKKKGRTQELES